MNFFRTARACVIFVFSVLHTQYLFTSPLYAENLPVQKERQTAFIESFVDFYDCSQEGRYTHEYHPYLLDATKQSLKKLESFFTDQGFVCPHRLVIMGYQEEGVAPFLPTHHPLVDDEYVHTTVQGSVATAHNTFGFLTGFLLKDAVWLQEQWGYKDPLVYHHMPERIGLFNDYAYCFQQQAFGADTSTLFAYRDALEKVLKKQDPKKIVQQLADFWQTAYQGELKSFSHQLLATQDILFSIEYARHLTQSAIPVKTIYTGPDITYPIEHVCGQEQQATASAQSFIDFFSTQLVPVDNKKTAYIFCSFVDGVGKSTLLGNTINYTQYGHQIDQYTRVDNSSSQTATLYEVNNQVVILDLPAQLSHFVSKPDGYVFVPLAVAGQDNQQELEQFIKDHKEKIITQYKNSLDAAGEQTIQGDLYTAYIQTLQLFDGAEKQDWIPFEYNNSTYLFNLQDSLQDSTAIQVAVPLEGVQSRGLKVAHPAHMLFTKGLSLPMQEDLFRADCAQKLQAAGVERLVFVDFLSMYPRSSRETVRVNFMVQELKKLYGDLFAYERSFYAPLVHGNVELFYNVQHQMPQITLSLVLETVMRTALFDIFHTHGQTETVRKLTPNHVTQLLRTACSSIFTDHKKLLTEKCQQKVLLQKQLLQHVVHDKLYHTVVDFSWQPLLAFSDFMRHLWTNIIHQPLLSELWATMPVYQVPVSGVDSFHVSCKDQVTFAKNIPLLRSLWYVSLANLVHASVDSQGCFSCLPIHYPAVPVMLSKNSTTQMVSLSTYPCNAASTMPENSVLKPCLDLRLPVGYDQETWGVTHGAYFLQPFFMQTTDMDLFGLGYAFVWSDIRKVVDDHRYSQGKKVQDGFITSSQLVQLLDEQGLWKKIQQDKKNGKTKRVVKKDDPAREAIALMVRALATLEMIAKDPHASIITRRGIYQDFRATVLLLERVILPRLFNVELTEPLFADYGAIAPVISWDVICCR